MELNRVLSSGQYFGTITSLHKTGGIQLCETRYDAREVIPKHFHELPFFCYVLQGTFSEIGRNRTLNCKPGTVIFHPPGDLHSDRVHDNPSRCFNIEFFQGISEMSDAQPWNSCGIKPSLIAMRIFQEFKFPDNLSSLAIEGLSMELMAAGLREFRIASKEIPRWLKDTKAHLQDCFVENFSFKQLALGAGVHPVHLARSFRKFYGTTVAEYVRSLRVEHACNLLHGHNSIAEIALASGFCDQSHFTKIFKRFTGMTPTQFRRLR